MGTLGQNDGSVMSCDLQGNNTRTIVPPGVTHTPKQLAIDKDSQKLYFCDREGMRIMRCYLDGSCLETLVQTGSRTNGFIEETEQRRWCVGIALAPAEQKFYWSQKGPSKGFQGQIFRASMHMPAGETAATRSDIECLVSGLPEPIHLEIDEENMALYWTDRGELPMGNTLNRAWLSNIGTRGYDVLARNLHEAMGLALDKVNGLVYVTDLGGTVYRFDMDGKNRKKVYDCEGTAFTGVAIKYAY